MIEDDRTPAYRNGVAYLDKIQFLLPDPQMVDVMANLRDRVSICNWIGNRIESVNISLQAHLNACHECFHPIVGAADLEANRRSIRIFAVPFASSVRLDGFCNITTTPTSARLY